jgi:hypothetical protein
MFAAIELQAGATQNSFVLDDDDADDDDDDDDDCESGRTYMEVLLPRPVATLTMVVVVVNPVVTVIVVVVVVVVLCLDASRIDNG